MLFVREEGHASRVNNGGEGVRKEKQKEKKTVHDSDVKPRINITLHTKG